MSLIELMVAVTIGLVLIAGALAVFIESRSTARVNETLARIQENGLYAASELGRGLELAGYWGENNNNAVVEGRTIRDGGSVATASTLPKPATDCTTGGSYPWYTDLDRPLFGLDAGAVNEDASANTGEGDANYTACLADYLNGTDVVVVRYVEPLAVPAASLQEDTVYIRSDPTAARIFVGTTEPSGFSGAAANYLLRSYAYYIRLNGGVPELARVQVVPAGGGGLDTEPETVMTGIENLQVQYGIDTDGDSSADQYRHADNVGATQWDDVVAVRYWLLVRADRFEKDYCNTSSYALPQYTVQPAVSASVCTGLPVTDNRRARRLILTRTVQVRNLQR